jgi:hypothetical protein
MENVKLFTSWLLMLLLYLTPTPLLETIVSQSDTLTSQSNNRRVKIKFRVKNLDDEDPDQNAEEPATTAHTVFEILDTPPSTPPSSPTPLPRRPRAKFSIGRGRGKVNKVHPYLKRE